MNLLESLKQLLKPDPLLHSATQIASAPTPRYLWLCPHCGGTMTLIEKLTAQQLRWRSVGRESFCDTS